MPASTNSGVRLIFMAHLTEPSWFQRPSFCANPQCCSAAHSVRYVQRHYFAVGRTQFGVDAGAVRAS